MKIDQLLNVSEAQTASLLKPRVAPAPVKFGKGTALPTKPYQIPGMGTSPVPGAPGAFSNKAVPPTTAPAKTTPGQPAQAAPAATPASPTAPAAPTRPKTDWVGKIGSAARTVGNIGSELGTAAGQMVTAPFGGAVRGYQTARHGGTFTPRSGGGSSGPGYIGGAGSNANTMSADGPSEVDDIKASLQAIDQRMRKAGI